jgi:hypothetical protein
MTRRAIDVHQHYVPKQLLDETKSHGKSVGVEITENKGIYALSFAGSKPHQLQRLLMDVDKRIEIMDQGQVALATLEGIEHLPKVICPLYQVSVKPGLTRSDR